ncbi:alpha-E domain-containing protein [Curtobacterium flaccumfaciens]|nr:alpha-E domain-containing protein [Curtobacterium flaccumfaciens]
MWRGEAFLRGRDHHSPQAEDAAAFLLLDEHSPRSLRFLARRADECLADVAPLRVDDEVRAFAEARAALESVSEHAARLAAQAAARRLAVAADRVVAALEERVFAVPEPAR